MTPEDVFLSVRVPPSTRDRLKAVAAAQGSTLQVLVRTLVDRHLSDAERKPPQLGDVLHRLRDNASRISQHGVAHLWIFGSVARGTATRDSDVDLAVEFTPEARPSVLTLSHLKNEVETILGHAVDIGERDSLTPQIAAEAERDMVLVL